MARSRGAPDALALSRTPRVPLELKPMTNTRPDDRKVENENLRPDADGEPPRPATEPKGAEGSSNSGETATDPATGEAN